MKQYIVIAASFLLLFSAACNNGDKESPKSENDIDAARNFIRSALDGKFNEAKQLFIQAKDRLAQTSEVNSKVLASDIVMSLAIINDEFAKKEFQKEMNISR